MRPAKRAALILVLPFLLAATPPPPPPPAPVLTGQVVDGDGRPVAGAQVQAVALESQRAGTEPPVKSRTGKDGRFRLGGFPAGTALALEASAEGFAPSLVRTSMETSAPSGKPAAKPRPPLRIVLGRGSTLTGRIVDPQGQPAGGAEVVLSASFEGPDAMIRFAFGDPTRRATADPKGRFRIERLAAGAFQLWADHPSFASVTQPRIKIPDKPAEIPLGDIRLLAAAFLEGQVTDERGAPVAGASVILRPTDGDFMAFHEGRPVEPVQTGADGSFRSGRVAAGTRVNVSVEHPAYVDAHAPGVEVPAAEPLLITLQPGRSLNGRVVDPAGKPVAGAQLLPAPETGIGMSMVHSMNGGPRTMSDEDGRFVLDGLSPGPLALWVTAEGYRMETVRGLRIPETDEVPPLEIVLTQGAAVEGRVLDERSRPVAGAFVNADPVQGYSVESVLAQSGSHTGEDGRYRVNGLPPGRFRVRAQTPEGRLAEGTIEIAEGATGAHPLDLRLDTGFLVSGRVLDDMGAPVAGASLQLSFSVQPRVFQKISGADGSFLFSNVPAGSWRLSASAAGFAETDLPGEIRVGEEPAASVAGIELRLERGGTVTGQVLGLAPEDLARVQISAFRAEEGIQPINPPSSVDPFSLPARLVTDDRGLVALPRLAAGTYQIHALHAGNESSPQRFQVTPGGTTEVQVVMP